MECRFCDIVNGKKSKEPHFYNEILIKTPNFIVIPALGSFVSGYVMILTRKCLNSISVIPTEQRLELSNLIKVVKDKLSIFSSKITIFEHGSSVKNSLSSACISHAHLHIVAKQIIAEDWKSSAFIFSSIGDFMDSPIAKNAYLLLGYPDGNYYAKEYKNEPCQFFRRVCVNEMPFFIEWDYHVEQHENNILLTINAFKK